MVVITFIMVRCANRSLIEVLVELGTEGLELGTHLKQGSHDQAKETTFKDDSR